MLDYTGYSSAVRTAETARHTAAVDCIVDMAVLDCRYCIVGKAAPVGRSELPVGRNVRPRRNWTVSLSGH